MPGSLSCNGPVDELYRALAGLITETGSWKPNPGAHTMKIPLLPLLIGLLAVPVQADEAVCSPLLDVELRRLASDETVRLCDAYRGKVLLLVNTASKCGFTPQYEGLEALYSEYRDRGLVVLGFPSNDFMGQEPGSEEQISEFCRLTYSVEFPMFEKMHVRGQDAHPLFARLVEAGASQPQWNFYKYLIGRDGNFVAQYPSTTKPTSEKLVRTIEGLL